MAKLSVYFKSTTAFGFKKGAGAAENGAPAKSSAFFGNFSLSKKGKEKQEDSLENMLARLDAIAATKQKLRADYDKLHTDYIALQVRYGMFDPDADEQETRLNAMFRDMSVDDQ